MQAAHSPCRFPLFAASVRVLSALCFFWLAFAAVGAAQAWTQAWSDEFNGLPNSAINPANWQYDT